MNDDNHAMANEFPDLQDKHKYNWKLRGQFSAELWRYLVFDFAT